MRILVTGGSGFVGRWAIQGLLRRDVEVATLSRGTSPIDGARTMTANLFDAEATRQVIADVRPDAILHCAWNVEPGRFWEADANCEWIAATTQLARFAADAGVTRIVGVGTCFEYAWPDNSACDETTTPIAPTTPYAIAKDATRRALAGLCSERNLSFSWARLFFLYGPFEHPSRLVPSLAINLARGLPAPLSSGNQVRDFMEVRDAGDALAALAVSSVAGDVNIGTGRAVTLAEIADCLGRIAGRPDLIARGAIPDRPNEAPYIVAATERLRTEVGAPAPRPLEQGLAESYAWWQSRAKSMA